MTQMAPEKITASSKKDASTKSPNLHSRPYGRLEEKSGQGATDAAGTKVT